MKDKEISLHFVEHTVILYLLTFKYKDIANWWSLNTTFKSKNYLQRVHNSTKEFTGTFCDFKLNSYTCTYSIANYIPYYINFIYLHSPFVWILSFLEIHYNTKNDALEYQFTKRFNQLHKFSLSSIHS